MTAPVDFTPDGLRKMHACAVFLGSPADEVVRACTGEIERLQAALRAQVTAQGKAVAWQYRQYDADEGWSGWIACSADAGRVARLAGCETRALYTAPAPQAERRLPPTEVCEAWTRMMDVHASRTHDEETVERYLFPPQAEQGAQGDDECESCGKPGGCSSEFTGEPWCRDTYTQAALAAASPAPGAGEES